ncbi:MAG TPA: hypothetical protein DF383_09695, partial [Deltaproteobacteria bacterium]|nr:hypothetical protein [Deltaproteobacteria bacterium]
SETEADFKANIKKVAKYLVWQGIRMQQVFPKYTLDPEIVRKSQAAGDGVPTAMLDLKKLSRKTVQKYVDQVNQKLPEDQRVHISLVNGPRAIVVSGPPESNHLLLQTLREAAVKPGEEKAEAKKPFSKRKIEFSASYFPVSAAFHSPYMKRVAELLREDVKRLNIAFKRSDLKVPVYDTLTGRDLRQGHDQDLMEDSMRLQSSDMVDYVESTAKISHEHGITHVVGFGPGRSAGISAITARNTEGKGVQVIVADSLQASGNIQDKSVLYNTDPASLSYAQDWVRDFGPKLVRLPDGSEMVDTRFTRLVGKPPVMVGGMTPTTASEPMVTATIRAGYHIEVAGGGQPTPQHFRDRVKAIFDNNAAGEGITPNLLFLDPYLFGFQYPLVEVLANEGNAIDGATIAAGVPPPEKAGEILSKLRNSGLRHVSFKPGNVDAINQVIEIAKNNPESQIILQWTGGRGGGHHSYEDMHEPILRTYAAMRRLPNLVLVAGSGIGDAKSALHYMTGEWSTQYGHAPMPFDGVMVASRVMAAEEALTSPEVKQLIVDAPGVTDQAKWDASYDGPVGGVRTVNSELGAPIHKVNNRAIELWAKYDKEYFKPELTPDEAKAKILADKDKIIQEINENFQKPYFGKKADGRVADLDDMTYEEVARRMVELMTVERRQSETVLDPITGAKQTIEGSADKWIDVTFRHRVFEFLRHIEDHFTRSEDSPYFLQSTAQLETNPKAFLDEFFKKYSEATKPQWTMSPMDVDHFLQLCRQPGKPVNFVPVIDGDLKFWFKKDSLWYSEDIDAVPNRDPQRVAVLHGPVAADYTTQANEPVAKILGDINNGIIQGVKDRYYQGKDIPNVEYLGGEPIRHIKSEDMPHVKISEIPDGERKHIISQLPAEAGQLPDAHTWAQHLAGSEYSWLRALLTTPSIMQNKTKTANPIARLIRPRPGQRVEITQSGQKNEILSFAIFDSHSKVPGTSDLGPAVRIQKNGDQITVTINHAKPATSESLAEVIPLEFFYRYNPKQGYAPIHEVMEGKNQRVKDFYAKLWFGQEPIGDLKVGDVLEGSHKLTRSDIRRFVRAIRNQQKAYQEEHLKDPQAKLQAPLDMAVVAAWKPLIKTVFPKSIDGNIFDLLHLSNGFDVKDVQVHDASALQEGDKLDTRMRILEVRNEKGGKRIAVKGTLHREGKPIVELTSEFFIRGKFSDFENTFQLKPENRIVTLDKPEAVAVLQSKKWF